MDYFTILCSVEMLQKMHDFFGALTTLFGLKVGLQVSQESQVLRLIVSVLHALKENIPNVERGFFRFLNPESAPSIF